MTMFWNRLRNLVLLQNPGSLGTNINSTRAALPLQSTLQQGPALTRKVHPISHNQLRLRQLQLAPLTQRATGRIDWIPVGLVQPDHRTLLINIFSEQGSSNASETGYSNWQANMRSPNSSTSYGETNHEDGPNHEGGRDHNNYASSNRTPSYKSGDEPNGGNQSTGQPVSQHNAPQSPYPYSEWDRYDSTQALNEVEKFK